MELFTCTKTIGSREPVTGGDAPAPRRAEVPPAPPRPGPAGETDTVLFLCPVYDAQFPSGTLWQRLAALTQVAKVAVLPLLPPPDGVIPPPAGAFLVPPPAGPRLGAPRAYNRRVRHFLRGLLAQGKRGLVWTHPNFFTRAPAGAAARAANWPLVTDVWDVPDLAMWTQFRERRYLKAFVHRCMLAGLRRHLERSDLVVWTLHPASMPRYFEAGEGRVLWLPNGLRWSALEPFRQPAAGPPVPDRPRRLLYMGHFRASRGSGLMVQALELAARSRPFVLDIVGDTATGVARAAVRSLSPELRARTRLHGRLAWESAMRVVRQADIGLYPFPSTPELEYIYPLKLLEYAGLGKWIVSSDLAGARHQLRDYNKARFCDPTSPVAWARVIEDLLDMPPAQFGAPANSAAIAAYDWERVNAALLDRVAELVRQPARSR